MITPKAQTQLQKLSRPILILLSIALGLVILFQLFAAVSLLFFFGGEGSWHAAVSFAGNGLNLSVFTEPGSARGVLLEDLVFGQRAALAALGLICGACGALVLFHLRQLFTLYTRGVVFSEDNIRHIKRFGLWLVVAAIVINVAGRLFPVITGEPATGTANAALALIYGGMTFVIARVMELGRQADEERKEFV